ncbi:MAG: hypothetical protein N3G21_13470 [Candidatus Hydrogenedentes bacterium]|nr:hypothetical protein [Candidatus Hydrogenedentota bacterium]
MFSFIEVKCPHCGAQGRIVLPPIGTILIGPCPQCKGMVALFNGTTMPLDNKIITEGTLEEKKRHIIDVFTAFIEEKVEDFFRKQKSSEEKEAQSSGEFNPEGRVEELSYKINKKKPITREEVRRFKESEINLLDDPEAFRKFFNN